MKNLQTFCGIAALGYASSQMVGLVLSFTLMFPLLNAAPDQAQKFVTGHPTLVFLWKLIVEWGAAVTFVAMLHALYARMKVGSPAFMRAAVFFGFLWVGLTLVTNDLSLHNFGVVVNLFGNAAAQAAALTALARALWVLLLSLAALRTGALTRGVGYLGTLLGSAGMLTLIPAIAEPIFLIFGPGMMVWPAWLGIVLLRSGFSQRGKQQRLYFSSGSN